MTIAQERKPNLLLIGAQKSGTTSIASALGSHKRVFLPPEKELNFFSSTNWAERVDDYFKRFPDQPHLKYWMDATPGYMWTHTAYGRQLGDKSPIKHDIPTAIRETLGTDLKIIAIMRHPIRRAVSAFFHQFRMGRLHTGDRIRNIGARNGIIDLGFYSEHLAAYRETFSEDAIKTLFFESYMRNTEMVHRDLFIWLDLDPTEIDVPAFETNEGIKLDYQGGNISVNDGMDQINTLAATPNYKKMKLIEPPIVEEADLDFMNEIYADELERMANEYPITAEIWPRSLSLDTYSSNPSVSGALDLQLSASQRVATTLDRQVRHILLLYNEARAELERHGSDLKKQQELLEKLEQDLQSRFTELNEMSSLLHSQETRHTATVEGLEKQLAASRQEIASLRQRLQPKAQGAAANS